MGVGVLWFPYISGALLAAAVALAKIIAQIGGLVYVSLVVRDVVAGESTPVELSRDETIEKIMDDPTLTPEQKAALIESYIGEDSEFVAVVNKLMIVAVVIAVAYVAVTYTKGK